MVEEFNTYRRLYDSSFIVKLRKDGSGKAYETYINVENGMVSVMEREVGGDIIKSRTLGTIEQLLERGD